MKKRYFNLVIIALIAILLGGLELFGLLEQAAKYMLIPILIFYYIGQYSERNFKD